MKYIKKFENLGFDLQKDDGLEIIKKDQELFEYLGKMFGSKELPLVEWSKEGDRKRFFVDKVKWLIFIHDNGLIYIKKYIHS